MNYIREKKVELFLIIIAVIFVLITRIPFLHENINFNNDAQTYSENMEKDFFDGTYDVQVPGYVGYIYLGRLLNIFIKNTVKTQHFINIVLIILITFAFFKLLKLLDFNDINSLIYTMIFSLNNILLLGSITGGNRLFLTISSVILIYLSIRIIREERNDLIILFSALFAFFIGFRQDISFYFFPLFVYLCYKTKKPKQMVISIVIFSIICLTWFIPMMLEYGDIKSYINILTTNKAITETSIIFSDEKISPIINISRVFIYMLNAFFLIYPFFIISLIKKEYRIPKDLLIILSFSFFPALLLQLFLHNGNFVQLAAFMVPFFIFLIYGYRFNNIKSYIFSVMICILLLFQFFGIKMFDEKSVYKKIVNVLWLQYSYDGVKGDKTYRLSDLSDDLNIKINE